LERQVNNLNNSPLLNTYNKICCIVLFTVMSIFTLTAQQNPLQGNKKYTINSLTVSGEQSFNEKTVIAFTGLKIGDRIYIPGEKLSEITKKLWDQGLFSDIAFYVTNIIGDKVDLELNIVELPKIKDVTIVGIKNRKRL
jgi:outer membrane protein insertion porin family